MIEITEIKDKKTWDEFLERKEIQFYPLFQSWNWGEVQKHIGYGILRIGAYQGKNLVGVCQIIDVSAKRGHYLHLRHGPVLNPFNQKVFDTLLEHVITRTNKQSISFIRMSPVVRREFVNYEMLKKWGFKNAPIHNMDAEVCWVLDITKTEEELLAGMRKSHRYLIKKGLKIKDLRIKKTKNISAINQFLNLYQSLSHRKHFVPHRGVVEEFEIFSKDDQEVLYLAEYLPAGRQVNKKIIAGALIAFVGNNALYRHSASDDNYRDIPGMHLILWEAIKDAKIRGKQLFNFWGIAPENSSRRHPWQGLTLFKTGFGGYQLSFLHAQDLPLSLAYWKTYAIEFISKIIKGY